MKRAGVVLLVVLAVCACSTAAFAASPWTTETGYKNQVVGKLGFGVKNLLLGWVDLFKEPANAGSGHLAKGISKGVVDLVCNEVGGALHTVTFFLPQVDVPLPDNGVQL